MTRAVATEQAYRTLSGRLDRGVYPPGSRLPAERILTDDVGVSRSTLRLALAKLADEGRLVASAQRGWFVPQLMLGEPPSMLMSFTELARSRGLEPAAEVLSNRVRPATFGEAEDLQIPPAAPVVELVRRRSMDGVPITVETAVLPHRLAEWLVDTDMTDRSLYELLAEHGLQVHRSTYTVQAANVDEREAARLELSPGSAVLLARDITFAIDRTPLVITLNCYRGDAYRFTADLFRTVG